MMTMPLKDLPLVMLGAGGHAKVLLSLAEAAGWTVLGVCDPQLSCNAVRYWRDVRVLGGDDALDSFDPSSVGLINGVGQLVGSAARRKVFESFRAKGFSFPVLVHPAAWVDASVQLGEGVQVMAAAVIQADTRAGCNAIINTSASVDHDCHIGAHAHVAPGAILCGNVTVNDHAFIGSGATVIQGLTVGEEAVVGAGAVLVRDLPPGFTLIGADARPRQR